MFAHRGSIRVAQNRLNDLWRSAKLEQRYQRSYVSDKIRVEVEMGKIKGNLKIHELTCGHKGPIAVSMNPIRGKCVQCGADVKVEMEVVSIEPDAQPAKK